MKLEDQILLLCLRQDFKPEHSRSVIDLASRAAVDWNRVAQTAEEHGISTLIQRNLEICVQDGLDLPNDALQKLKLSTYKAALSKESQKEKLVRALAYLQDHGLEVMLIKGAALDFSVYQDADYILSDDIDIIIRAKREQFNQQELKDFDNFFHKQGIEFEFFVHHDLSINELLPIDFESIWENAERADYLGQPILLMSGMDLLISLCINSSRKRYFRLKSIFDIRETIHAKQDISWQQVADRAQCFQSQNIVFTALLVTLLTSGCDLPVGWEEYFSIQPIRRKLIETTVKYLIDRISFYPYPYEGISILGRPLHLTLVLPYIGYTKTQITHKFSYAVRTRSN